MAKLNTNKVNALAGLVGEVVFSVWKGKPIVKSKPMKSSRPPSEKQLFQRAKMNAVMDFLRPYRQVVNRYFDLQPPNNTLHNLANSYYLNHALSLDGTTISIALDKVILTKGGLRGVENPEITVLASGDVRLSWFYTPDEAGANPDDELYVALYAPETPSGLLFTQLAMRQDCEAVIPLQPPYTTTEIHLWAGFIAHDGSQASWSMYLGSEEARLIQL